MKIKQFLLSLLLIVAVLSQIYIVTPAKVTANANFFSDVTESHPNYTAISELQKLGILQGYGDGTFQPDRLVNRAEALKIILSGSGIDPLDTKNTAGFNDINPSEWYVKYVAYAASAGIIQGYADHTFRPVQTINLVENLKILLVTKKINLDLTTVTQKPYTDVNITDWYAKHSQFAKIKNLLDADSQNKIYPTQDMTRAKLAETIYRLIYIQKNGLDSYPSNLIPPPQPTPPPVTSTTGAVNFTVDPTANRQNISPYIYGNNEFLTVGDQAREPNQKLIRLGGNRWTGYNWENNASNAGTDWQNSSDGYLSNSNTPGDAVKTRVDQAFNIGAAALVTVPIVDYVAADKNGPVNSVANANNARWNKNLPNTTGSIPANPNLTDKTVFEDQFINWVQKTYQTQFNNGRKLFYSLDNEPALWPLTHPLIHPDKTTFAEMAKRTIDYSTMIKNIAPQSVVFGAVAYGYYEFVALQDAPDRNGRDYFDFFLDTAKTAETNAGKRLVDVLDLHWYPEAMGGGVRISSSQSATPSAAEIEARVQAPRSLWDLAYVENSWISNDALNHGPIKLIPWLKDKIANHYPGTKLAFTEYNYGGENHISGGLAEADVLGIFGREGIFASTYWPMQFNTPNSYIYGAFDLYLNYDGKGSTVGDTSVLLQNSNTAETSAYAIVKNNDPTKLYIIAINKTTKQMPANISLKNSSGFTKAALYQLTSAQSKPQSAGTVSIQNNALSYQMPALSATLFVVQN